jgi:hypothetical protein
VPLSRILPAIRNEARPVSYMDDLFALKNLSCNGSLCFLPGAKYMNFNRFIQVGGPILDSECGRHCFNSVSQLITTSMYAAAAPEDETNNKNRLPSADNCQRWQLIGTWQSAQ